MFVVVGRRASLSFRKRVACAAFVCGGVLSASKPASAAQPPALAPSLDALSSNAFFVPRVRVPLVLSLDRVELESAGITAELPFVATRLDSAPDPSLSFKRFWYGGTRDAQLRGSRSRAQALRNAAAGVAMTGGIAMMLGGGAKGGRRGGTAGQAPIVDAGSHTRADLGVVAGSGVLLTSVLIASAPLEGGVRRLRPMPIGGRRWGGVAARWRF